VTVLQGMYADLRGQGYSHYQAIRELARQMRVDSETVKRVLQSAEDLYGRSWREGRFFDTHSADHRRIVRRARRPEIEFETPLRAPGGAGVPDSGS
jgi:hypothetical protein